jgi:hypothetical protein
MRCLVYTTLTSPEPGRDTLHGIPPGGMLEVDKGSQHQLRIVFGRSGTSYKVSTATYSRNDIVNQLNAAGSVTMQRVRRRLHEGNLWSRRPCIHIPFTSRHCHALLEWTMKYTQYTMQHWRHVLFTDESTFCIDFTKGGISWDGWPDLVELKRGTLTGQRYRQHLRHRGEVVCWSSWQSVHSNGR